ncbi:MAG: HAD hydrolase family protein [bacterium]|nr:HAD hydrolase family protein [bacterium]MCP4799417.1 HAD hydrolase family protein [bacterium]
MTKQWPPFSDSKYLDDAKSQLNQSQLELFQNVKAMVFDADGILTSGNLLFGVNGEELKEFNVKDGLGLVMARTVGIKLALLTGRNSKVAESRAKELRFDSIKLGRFDKQTAMKEILSELGYSGDEALYMGDDLIDIPAMDMAQLAVTVPEACPDVKSRADFVTSEHGGSGAVREVTDLVLKSRQLYGKALVRLAEKAWF